VYFLEKTSTEDSIHFKHSTIYRIGNVINIHFREAIAFFVRPGRLKKISASVCVGLRLIPGDKFYTKLELLQVMIDLSLKHIVNK